MDVRTEDKIRLLDMADSIREIQGYIGSSDLEEFNLSEDIRESVATQMTMIGEASDMLSDDFKEEYSNIDWNVLSNLKYAHYDEELEQETHPVMYLASRDLPEMMNELLDVATMLEDEDDLEEVSLNEEDKQDISDMLEERRNKTQAKAEEVFADDEIEDAESRLENYDEEDDSYANRQVNDNE